MKLQKGNMLLNLYDVLLFTANNVVNGGRLAMGAGVAKQIRDRFPSSSILLGNKVLIHRDTRGFYGLVFCHQSNCRLGAFQTKYHWNQPSDLDLIKASVERLEMFCALTENRGKLISLNFPGIGLGGLKKEDVLPILTTLPDNVTIWER